MGLSMLKAHVVKRRREFTVDVTLTLERAERLALFGPSAAGKSTVLSCIAGFETPDGGEIVLDGQVLFPPPAPLYRRPLAYLTQKDLLFPHLTVGQNVCFGLNGRSPGLSGASADELARWIAELKEKLKLEPIWNVPARAVSGGQARRVALARMLARRPPVLLLDEPFASLDKNLTLELVETLLEWHRTLAFALIAADHRSDVLKLLCPKVAAIERGRIVQLGRWEELKNFPATPVLARLLS